MLTVRRALLAAAVAALLLPAGAGAKIVVGKSIAGVAIGMTEKQVRAKLRKPIEVERRSYPTAVDVIYTYRSVTVTLRRGRVAGLTTRSPRERTKAGIGVGSTEAQVRAKVPGVTCRPQEGRCVIADLPLQSGSIVTTFLLSGGRVELVDIRVL